MAPALRFESLFSKITPLRLLVMVQEVQKMAHPQFPSLFCLGIGLSYRGT